MRVRAVLCRAGVAVELSEDHKPEDDVEKTRIEAAGGKVDDDGRIEGGLNLSRALGDWNYKLNADKDHCDQVHVSAQRASLLALTPCQPWQMVSPLPDLVVAELTPDDEFLVMACDGIWNSMTSQEVVDFVRQRLAQGEALKDLITQVGGKQCWCLQAGLFLG